MPMNFSVQGSNDGSTWQTLSTYALGTIYWNTAYQVGNFDVNNSTSYSYYRLMVTGTAQGSNVRIAEIGLSIRNGQPGINYYTDEYLIPVMSADSQDGYVLTGPAEDSYVKWKAFDRTISQGSSWGSSGYSTIDLVIEMPEAKECNLLRVACSWGGEEPEDIALSGSNDGVSYTPLVSESGITWTLNALKDFTIANPASYQYYKFTMSQTDTGWMDVSEIQLIKRTIHNS